MGKPNYYAGLGSRETPYYVGKEMERFGYLFDKLGYLLSSGHAQGADMAFETGMLKNRKKTEAGPRIFFPGANMNNTSVGKYPFYINSTKGENWEKAKEIALEIHPNPTALKKSLYPWFLHSRNVFQILGEDLKTPVEFMVYWAPWVGAAKEACKGGTNTALQLCKRHAIPTYNLIERDDLEAVKALIYSIKQSEFIIKE